MSRREKLLAKLRASPANFRWSELETLMSQHDFTASCTGGSHYVFEHKSGFTFSASKTHPSGILKHYQVKEALEALARVGAIA